jgi:hypothetical protein
MASAPWAILRTEATPANFAAVTIRQPGPFEVAFRIRQPRKGKRKTPRGRLPRDVLSQSQFYEISSRRED